MHTFLRSLRRGFGQAWNLAILSSYLLAITGCGGGPREAKTQSHLDGESYYRGILLASGPVADLIPEIRDHLKVTNFVTDEERLRAIGTVQDQIVAQIRATDPTFFENFRSAVVSGNQLTVQEWLTRGANATLNAIVSIGGGRIAAPLQDPRFEEAIKKGAEARNIDPQTVAQAKMKIQRLFADASQRPGGINPDGNIDITVICREPAACSGVFVIAAAVYVVAAIDVVLAVSYAAVIDLAVAVAVAVTEAVALYTGAAPGPTGSPSLNTEMMINRIATDFAEGSAR
jgi:hypothetical protein